MQPLAPASTETPRDSATVVLLRDTPTGLQTLLLRRHTQMANMGGVYVFPGGKLDAHDSSPASLGLLDQSCAQLHSNLCEPTLAAATAAGLHVAALREALEECGLLLAEPATPQAHPNAPLNAPQARALLRQGQAFADVLATLGLRLATRQLVPWSRWITPLAPAMSTRRFDTRFFVAQAPADQTAQHDNEETTESAWLTPREALEQYRDGRIDLAPPQIMSLAQLARHASVRSVLAAARGHAPPTILPEAYAHAGTRSICYPGDPLHSSRERALPGPTRLSQQGRLFLPDEGFDALFA